MSNRCFDYLFLLSILFSIVIAVCLLADIFLLDSRSAASTKTDSSFHSVNDTPLINNLQAYYELVKTGKTTITMDGIEYVIFWQDFSPEDRKRLQLQLRTP